MQAVAEQILADPAFVCRLRGIEIDIVIRVIKTHFRMTEVLIEMECVKGEGLSSFDTVQFKSVGLPSSAGISKIGGQKVVLERQSQAMIALIQVVVSGKDALDISPFFGGKEIGWVGTAFEKGAIYIIFQNGPALRAAVLIAAVVDLLVQAKICRKAAVQDQRIVY